MKKTITLLLALMLSLSLFACGEKDDNTAADQNGNTAAEDSANKNDTAKEPVDQNDTSKKIDRNIDAVADYLDLKKGDETAYSMIGAKAGREYDDGKIELYEFDKNSSEYDNITKGKGSIEAAACNDGFVLVTTEKADDKLIEKFKKISFK